VKPQENEIESHKGRQTERRGACWHNALVVF